LRREGLPDRRAEQLACTRFCPAHDSEIEHLGCFQQQAVWPRIYPNFVVCPGPLISEIRYRLKRKDPGRVRMLVGQVGNPFAFRFPERVAQHDQVKIV